jgi:hypothetical protein
MTKLLQKLASGMMGRDSYSEVIDLLRTLRETGSKIAIKIEGDNTVYSSVVTAFNARHQVFVVDNFNPPAPTVAFTKGRRFTISINTDDQTICLTGKYIEPLMANCDMGHQLHIPTQLEITGTEHEFDYTLAHLTDHHRNSVGDNRVTW